MKKVILPLLISVPLLTRAQIDSSDLSFAISGYAEPYYGYSLNKPADGNLPGFVYSYNRHNEMSVNVALLKGSASAERFRGNLALMAGTYANANLATEHGSLQHLYEANGGVKLSKKKELWIDGGIFSSHIGFESAVGKDCWTLTRSILAENSPYYEAGIKLSYTTPNEQWFFSALALNGWQHIQRVPGSSLVSSGWQIQYKPSSKITLNSSSFLGSDKPDSLSLGRAFHNFFGIFQFNKHFGLTLGLDTGWEDNARKGEAPNFWYSSVLIARYTINDRLTLAGRAEYYSDEEGVIISTAVENGFRTMGLSANLDVQVHKNAVWRIEGKWYKSKDDIFLGANGKATGTNTLATTALAVWF